MSDNDEIEQTPASREKVIITEKVKFSKKLNKLFSKANEIFNKTDRHKLLFDDAECLSKPDEMTIPPVQVIYKELNKGKLKLLNKSNEAFLDYLTSDYGCNYLAKNKIKIHLGTGNIYCANTNLEKSIYDFFSRAAKRSKKTLRL